MSNPEPTPLTELVRRIQAEATEEARRPDGSVDALVEALAFRRLIVEAAGRED